MKHLLPILIEDDDDLLLWTLLTKRPKQRKYYKLLKSTVPFDLDKLTDDFCWVHFRFKREHIVRLKELLDIPNVIKCHNRITVGGLEALCILLKRLSYPNRYADMMKYFPRTVCEISRIFSYMIRLIIRKHKFRLTTLNQRWLAPAHILEFNQALVRKGCPYAKCFAFLDGTVRAVCRPQQNQRQFFNGHRRVHAIKFQSMLVPNGLIAHLHGPVVGRRHDGFLLQSSGLMDQLEAKFPLQAGDPFHVYGDPAYPLLPHLITPFKPHEMSPAKAKCNSAMSSIRESVEWGFNKVIQSFAFLDYKKNLRVGLQPVHNFYIVGVILANCHSCLYSNQTAQYFQCKPPEIEEYLM